MYYAIGRHLSELVIDVVKRIAHHVDHTQLHLGMGKHAFDGPWQADETIDTGNEAIFHAAI